MKKRILTMILLLVASLLISPNFVSADLPTIVNGHVYAADGITPVPGVDVTVECNDIILVDTTNDLGYYVVEFFEGCPIGSEVTVSVGEFSESDIVADEVLIKNIVYINLSVPEFTLATGLIALAGAALVFMIIRRK